jgi:hypothetical protein
MVQGPRPALPVLPQTPYHCTTTHNRFPESVPEPINVEDYRIVSG